jgi:uncharacterized protein (DUF342 family)
MSLEVAVVELKGLRRGERKVTGVGVERAKRLDNLTEACMMSGRKEEKITSTLRSPRERNIQKKKERERERD